MGRIHAAWDLHLGREVAIKRLLVKHPQVAARFDREARITARLQHPSIVTVYEAGLDAEGEPFLVMKLVRGRSLEDLACGASTVQARLNLVPSVLAVAEAIAYAHGLQIIHRDLSTRNVLVGEFGETVVIDWGLAKDLNETWDSGLYRSLFGAGEPRKTAIGSIFGTPAYMSPQQARGEPLDERGDVYAIGAILYRVLGGAPPYDGETLDDVVAELLSGPPPPLASLQRGLPPALIAIVEHAMARDDLARHPTARELAADLRRLLRR